MLVSLEEEKETTLWKTRFDECAKELQRWKEKAFRFRQRAFLHAVKCGELKKELFDLINREKSELV